MSPFCFTDVEKMLDGCYTRMLRKIYNLNSLAKVSNNVLYKGINKITNTIRIRRLKLASHVFRDKSSPAQHTVTWDLRHGQISRGRSKNTFITTLLKDTGLNSTAELEACMEDIIDMSGVNCSYAPSQLARIDRK